MGPGHSTSVGTSWLQVSLLTIAGASFMGTHGVAERFMDSLAKVGVNASRLQTPPAAANCGGELGR